MGSSGSGFQQTSLPPFANPWAIAMLQSAGGQVFPNWSIDPTDHHIITGPMAPYNQGLNYQVSPFSDFQNQGFSQIGGQTGSANNLASGGSNATFGALNTLNPATNQYSLGALGQQSGTTQFGANTLAGNQALNSYGSNVLGGQFLNPNSNPNLQAYAGQAGSVLANQYALGTAPSLMAQAIGAGGGGPGALAGNSAFGQQQQFNQFSLGQNLANQNANIYNSAYNTGIGQMENAYGTGIGAQQGVFSGLLGQQENALGTSVAQQENALGLLPQTQQSLYTAGNQLLGAGSLQQQQQQNILDANRQNVSQQVNWPWQQLNNLSSIFGSSIGNAGTSVMTQTK